MSESRSFAIAGVAGRMGRQVVQAVLRAGHRVTGGTEIADSPARDSDIGLLSGHSDAIGVRPASDPVEAAADAHVWVDFTQPQATLAALHGLRHTTVRAVIIGTTGFSAAQEAEIAAASRHFAVVKAGNFSLGVNLLVAVTRLVAARLGPDWDIEILETHHRRKLDAPSGTALMLGDAAAAGRGSALETLRRAPYDGPDAQRSEGEIAFSVRRAGGVIGDHEALFANDSEIVSLSHRALDRMVFADGAVRAAEWALAQPAGLYDMEDVLGLKGTFD